MNLTGSYLGSTPLHSRPSLSYNTMRGSSWTCFQTFLRSTYMDDSMDSIMNEEDGIDLHRQLSQLLTQAGMHARKWLSNSSTVLKEIPSQDRKAEVDLDTDYLPSSKTLGVWWSADQDVFTFKENAPSDEMKYTKRSFLKKIAILFDPIGLLAPFTLGPKYCSKKCG